MLLGAVALTEVGKKPVWYVNNDINLPLLNQKSDIFISYHVRKKIKYKKSELATTLIKHSIVVLLLSLLKQNVQMALKESIWQQDISLWQKVKATSYPSPIRWSTWYGECMIIFFANHIFLSLCGINLHGGGHLQEGAMVHLLVLVNSHFNLISRSHSSHIVRY